MKNDPTGQGNPSTVDEPANVNENDQQRNKMAGQNSASNEDCSTTSAKVQVTAATVAELHQQVLAADSTITDAEAHLIAIAEVIKTEATAEVKSESPSVNAELDAAISKLEETAEQIEVALTGARTLRESAETDVPQLDDAGERGSTDQRSIFDKEGYVRNTLE